MTRKQRADSVSAAVKAIADAANLIRVPRFVKLSKEARQFWRLVVRARARDEWTDADLTVAGDLCECMADMRSEGALLKVEGYVQTLENGRTVQNPRNQVLEVLTRRKIALMRMLQMQPRVLLGSAQKVQEHRATEREAVATVKAVAEAEDGLLAGPTLQ